MDGTICEDKSTFERSLANMLPNAKEVINNWYDSGHTIIIYTARGWSEYNMTKRWLDDFGVKYHQLLCGKPIGDVWIDDRAIKFESWDRIINEIY